jgi:ubiquinone/menaquinone biosynthesis C-methylase UbiE
VNKEYYDTVKSEYPDLNVLWYDGGTIPLPDESFDFVVSFQVLEHVASIEHIINESIRILKPCGIMYHVCPNYHSFYEGHFNVVWLPIFNKMLGRFYLKLLHRYRPSYETLNAVCPKAVTKALEQHQKNISVISLGRAEFIDKFGAEQIAKVNQKLLRKTLKLLLALPLLRKCTLKLISWRDLYYPITIIVRKARNPDGSTW